MAKEINGIGNKIFTILAEIFDFAEKRTNQSCIFLNRIKNIMRHFSKRNDELYKTKIKLIEREVNDYYLTFMDAEEAKKQTEKIVLQNIMLGKIEWLYSKHLRKKNG